MAAKKKSKKKAAKKKTAKRKAAKKRKVAVPDPEVGFCFVLMPFDPIARPRWEDVYIEAIADAGLEPKRADSIFAPSSIIQDVWQHVCDAEILLADVTGHNPNVYYELGLAHARGQPVVLVAPKEEDIPFDLRSLRHLLYDKNDPLWGRKLKADITTALSETMEAPETSVLAPFVDVDTESATSVDTDLDRRLLNLEQQVLSLRSRGTSFAAPVSTGIAGALASDIVLGRVMAGERIPQGTLMGRPPPVPRVFYGGGPVPESSPGFSLEVEAGGDED